MARNTVLPLTSTYNRNKSRKTHSFGPGYVFDRVSSGYNPNAKYMFKHDHFKDHNPPVLRFYASYDNRGESPRDRMRFRNCHILFYVEDETIKVYEPQQRNAGFEQGCLLRRNRVPKPHGGYYRLEDFNMGKELKIFGKSFKILDCDPFTKNYLREMGYRVYSPEPAVIDPVYADRQEMDRPRSTLKKPCKQEYKLKTFYKSHPKCLHFYVIYNNNPKFLEEKHYASMYYNIVDKTIKIVDEQKIQEYKGQLSIGNYDTYLILKPTIVPKKFSDFNRLGNYSSPIILNLTAASKGMHLQELMRSRSGGANSIGFLKDPNPVEDMINQVEFYTEEDFDLGITIDVFGAKVYIYDCDEFTKEFYRSEFQKELVPVPLPEIKHSTYPKVIYKEIFGSPENSLKSCKTLNSTKLPQLSENACTTSENEQVMGVRSKYLLQYYLNCRNGCDGKILKFLAEVVADTFFKNQYFVVRFYLEDDTLDINGLNLNFTLTNSESGMFLKRMKLIKPTSEVSNAGACCYKATDMYVGNTIYAIKKPFYLIDADQYSYDYMERHCDVFVHSNIKKVMSDLFPLLRDKACEIKSACEDIDPSKMKYIHYADFKNIILSYIDKSSEYRILDQQLKTLARYYAFDDYVGLNINDLVCRIQDQLKKERFVDFEKLKTLFEIFDLENENSKGYFKPARIYEILRSYPLKVDRDILKSFAFKFPQKNGFISYKEVLKYLNYLENPTDPVDRTPYAVNINWEHTETVKNMKKICYDKFLKDLTNEKCPNCM